MAEEKCTLCDMRVRVQDNNLLISKCCLQIIKRYLHRWETWRCTWNWITRRRREKRWPGKVLVSLVSSPPPPQPLGPPPQPPLLSHLQLPHDCQIWTGKEHQTFFERIWPFSQDSCDNPSPNFKPFHRSESNVQSRLAKKTLAKEFLINAQACRCPVPAHQGEHQPFDRTEQKRERWENLPRVRWFWDSWEYTYLSDFFRGTTISSQSPLEVNGAPNRVIAKNNYCL